MVKDRILYILFVLFLSACSTKASKKRPSENYFQTPPPDMVFVQGNGSVPSFYIGVTEETNLNYNIYLNWLDTVYTTYRGVKEWATPKNKEWDSINYLNDPQYKEYFTHPAYAYYPVVGVSWLQAVEYLQWKGDRLNEAILYKIDWVDEKAIRNVNEEYSFNLESYLNYQYDVYLKINLLETEIKVNGGLNPSSNSEYIRKFNQGVLFPAMRLPTEAEWEFIEASSNASNNPLQLSKEYPFGKDYYLFKWDKAYQWGLSLNSTSVAPSNSIATQLQESPLTSNNSWGIINTDNTISEWLMDEYSSSTINNPREALTNSGFRIMRIGENLDRDGYLDEKNKFGKFKFIYYDFFPTGFGIPYERNTHLQNKYLSDSIFKIYVDLDTNNIDTLRFLLHTSPNYYNKKITNKYYSIKVLQLNRIKSIGLFSDSMGFYYQKKVGYLLKDKVVADFKFPRSRVIRNGEKREAMAENTSSLKTGFRAVVLHSGYPLANKKYKVKWGK